jgi:hypothetical protein
MRHSHSLGSLNDSGDHGNNGQLLVLYGDIGLVGNALAFVVGDGGAEAFLACGAVHLREQLLLSRLSQSNW